MTKTCDHEVTCSDGWQELESAYCTLPFGHAGDHHYKKA